MALKRPEKPYSQPAPDPVDLDEQLVAKARRIVESNAAGSEPIMAAQGKQKHTDPSDPLSHEVWRQDEMRLVVRSSAFTRKFKPLEIELQDLDGNLLQIYAPSSDERAGESWKPIPVDDGGWPTEGKGVDG